MRTTATRRCRCRSLSLPSPRAGPATHCILRERSTKATTAAAFGGSGCVNRARFFWWPYAHAFRPKRKKNSSWPVFLQRHCRRPTSDFRFTESFVRANVPIPWPNLARYSHICETWARTSNKKNTECVCVFIVYAFICLSIMRVCIILYYNLCTAYYKKKPSPWLTGELAAVKANFLISYHYNNIMCACLCI